MKIVIGILALIAAYFIVFPYKTERVCFDYCSPGENNTYVLYRLPIPETICKSMGKFPIVSYAWGKQYIGCSPYPGTVR